MLINGEWRNASNGATTTLHDPATDKEIAQVPQATAADVDAAVQAAKTALHHASATITTPPTAENGGGGIAAFKTNKLFDSKGSHETQKTPETRF